MKTIKILFLCQWGASTSHIERKIIDEGAKKDLKIEIKSMPIAGGYGTPSAIGEVDISQLDLILIAPQVRHQTREWQQRAERLGIPMAVLDFQTYGTQDAMGILKTITDTLKSEKNQ